jgi:HKD family nuclease
MDQAAVFLAGSILTALGFIVVIGAAVLVNNLLSKYWKPVRIFTSDSWNINPPVVVETEPKIEPKIDSTTRTTKQKIM